MILVHDNAMYRHGIFLTVVAHLKFVVHLPMEQLHAKLILVQGI